MSDALEQAYRHCQGVARIHARNFYYAFRTLPLKKRRAIYAAYAYCRLCDDVADGELPILEKRERFDRIRELLDVSMSRDGEAGDLPPEFTALRDAAAAFDIPRAYFEEIIEGVESDLEKTRFANFDELRGYCYKVASVVGLICIEVFGYEDPRAREYAVDMGIALQLTNILRDVKEDADIDRIYIPQDEIARFGVSEADIKAGVLNDNLVSLMKHQADRARAYYRKSQPLFDLIEPRARACPRVLHAAYAAILDRIEESRFDVFSRRIGLSAREKLLITARLWMGSVIPSIPAIGRPSR